MVLNTEQISQLIEDLPKLRSESSVLNSLSLGLLAASLTIIERSPPIVVVVSCNLPYGTIFYTLQKVALIQWTGDPERISCARSRYQSNSTFEALGTAVIECLPDCNNKCRSRS